MKLDDEKKIQSYKGGKDVGHLQIPVACPYSHLSNELHIDLRRIQRRKTAYHGKSSQNESDASKEKGSYELEFQDS